VAKSPVNGPRARGLPCRVRAFVVFLLVIAGGAVAADRVAEHVAAGEAESRLAEHGLRDPQVDVRGFPFLTQLAGRDFADVHVTGSALDVGGGQAQDVSMTGRDVTAPSGGDVTVGRLDGVGLVTYEEVVARSGVPDITIEPSDSADQVRLRGPVDVLGETVDVVADSRVRARGDRVQVTPRSFELADGGSVGGTLAAQLAERFTVTYTLRDLPDGVELRGVRATDGGFLVRVTGNDVVFPDLD
jgi:LmeA-like phospholipid-binding